MVKLRSSLALAVLALAVSCSPDAENDESGTLSETELIDRAIAYQEDAYAEGRSLLLSPVIGVGDAHFQVPETGDSMLVALRCITTGDLEFEIETQASTPDGCEEGRVSAFGWSDDGGDGEFWVRAADDTYWLVWVEKGAEAG